MAKPLHEQIKDARKVTGLNQREFAERIGFSGQTAIAKLEREGHTPSVETLARIAHVSGVPFIIDGSHRSK